MSLLQQQARVNSFFNSKFDELDNQTKEDIKNRKYKSSDADYYLRANITGRAGIHILLDEVNRKLTGITNFNENKLPKGVNLILEKLRIAYGKDKDEANSAKISYSNKLGAADIALQNGEFRIKQDGKIIVNLPVARLMAENPSYSTQGIDDTFMLGSLVMIKENLPITLEIEYPAGLTVGAGNTQQHHIEIRLMGTATTTK